MAKYYAMLGTEKVVCLGDFDSITDAMDEEPADTHWVFSELGLRDLRRSISIALGDE